MIFVIGHLIIVIDFLSGHQIISLFVKSPSRAELKYPSVVIILFFGLQTCLEEINAGKIILTR